MWTRLAKCVGVTLAGVLVSLIELFFQRQCDKRKGAPQPETASASPYSLEAAQSEPAKAPASVRQGPAAGREISEVEQVQRRIRSILNKLSQKNFDALYVQLLECCTKAADPAKSVEVVAREVFGKATGQHMLVGMYVDTCIRLHADLQKFAAGLEVCFRHSLLRQCEESFAKYLEPLEVDVQLSREEQYEALLKHKTGMLGNARFVAQLLRQKMLSPAVLLRCTDELLTVGSQETLETLSVFLETLGATFDTPDWKWFPRLVEVFEQVERLSKQPGQTPRIRCLLQDLLEHRQNSWGQPRTSSTSALSSKRRARATNSQRVQQPRGGAQPCRTTPGAEHVADLLLDSCDGQVDERIAPREGVRRRLRARQSQVVVPADGRCAIDRAGGTPAARTRRRTNEGRCGKHHCRFLVGIEHEGGFQVCRRLIGPGGENMKRILEHAPDAKIRIRGRGSNYLEGPDKVESSDPLMICVSSTSLESFERAAALVEELLEAVRAQHREFRSTRRYREPALAVQRLR